MARPKILDRLASRLGYERKSEEKSRGEEKSRTWSASVQPWEKAQGVSLPEDYGAYGLTYRDLVWVYVCTNRIATAAASVPFRVYRKLRRSGETVIEEVIEHPVIDLLDQVNPLQTRYDLWEGTLGFLEIAGNCYWELVRDSRGDVREIYFLHPHKVRVVPDEKVGVIGYLYEVNGRNIAFDVKDVIHHKYFNPNSEWYGQSSITAARNSVILDRLATQYNRNFFSQGAVLDGYLTPTDPEMVMTDEERIRIQEAWNQAYGGVNNSHRTAVLTGSLKYNTISLPPKDIEFLALKGLTKAEIAAAFGVPMPLIDQEKTTYRNYETALKDFWQSTMVPKLTKVAETITEQLLQKIDPTFFGEFDLSGVEALREDAERQTDIDVKLIREGVMLINEVRQERGLSPVPWGDTWWRPFNLVPADYTLDGGETDSPSEDDGQEDETAKAVVKGGDVDIFGLPLITYDPNDPRIVQTRALESNMMQAIRRHWQNEQNQILQIMRDEWQKEIAQEDIDRLEQLLDSLSPEIFERLIKPFILSALDAGGELAYKELGIEVDWELVDMDTKLFLEQYPNFLANDRYNKTREALRQSLMEGLEAGESVVLLQDRVSAIYTNLKAISAEMIARTEMIRAANRGKLAGYAQSGVVLKTQWIAVMDDRTCPFCEEMAGEVRTVMESYRAQGDVMEVDDQTLTLDYEDVISPPLHPFCRCTLVPYLKG